MSDNAIVAEWLRSLDLVHFTQSFLDNGYDDLDICKEIGDPDLDAIGVEKAQDRETILLAVEELRKNHGNRLYFILENPNYQFHSNYSCGGTKCESSRPSPPREYCDPPCVGDASGNNTGERGSFGVQMSDAGSQTERMEYCDDKKPPKPLSKKQILTNSVKDKLITDRINLIHAPYTGQDGLANPAPLLELSGKYSQELKASITDVLEILQDHRAWSLATEGENALLERVPSETTSLDSGIPLTTEQSNYKMYSVGGTSSRSVPPPLPACPPPSGIYADTIELEKQLTGSPCKSPRHVQQIQHGLAEEIAPDPSLFDGDNKKKSIGNTGTLSRFFKNVSIRKSGRKYIYKKHEGDLNAGDITMSDSNRIELMILVKEGKISMHDAVELVKQYEKAKREELAHAMEMDESRRSPGKKMEPTGKDYGDYSSELAQIEARVRELSEQTSHSPLYSPAESPMTTPRTPRIDHFEGTGTQMYSPIQNVRKQKKMAESKHKTSPKLFGSPGKFIKESSPTGAGKEKKKTVFSSPFTRRKGNTDSPKHKDKSHSQSESVLASIGYRKGSDSGSTSSGGLQSPHGTRKLSFGSRSQDWNISYDPDTATEFRRSAGQSYSPIPLSDVMRRGSESSSAYPLSRNTFTTFKKSPSHDSQIVRRNYDQSGIMSHTIKENYDYAYVVDGYTVTTRAVVEPRGYYQRSRSQSPGSKGHISVINKCHSSETAISTLLKTSSVDQVHIDPRSPKRYTASNITPPESHSPKRKHISLSSQSLPSPSHHLEDELKRPLYVSQDSQTDRIPSSSYDKSDNPEFEADTSPTGTLDSEDLKESKFGSSSTMSVGSETSPTTERKRVTKGPLDKITKYSRPRSSSYTPGDEYLSSEEDNEQRCDASFTRNSMGHSSLIERSNGDVRSALKKKPPKYNRSPKSPSDSCHGDRISLDSDQKTGSSMDSLHSSSALRLGSSSSSRSSMSVDDEPTHHGTFIASARAKVNFTPSSQDQGTFLTLKQGDIIYVLSMGESRIWRGVLDNKLGNFSCDHVEVLPNDGSLVRPLSSQRRTDKRVTRRSKSRTVEDLLKRLGMMHLLRAFSGHGYLNLKQFGDMEEEDLDIMGITDPQDRARILTAAQVISDYDGSPDESPGHEGSDTLKLISTSTSATSVNELTPQHAITANASHSPQHCITATPSKDSGCSSGESTLKQDRTKDDDIVSQNLKVVSLDVKLLEGKLAESGADSGLEIGSKDTPKSDKGSCTKCRIPIQKNVMYQHDSTINDKNNVDYDDQEILSIDPDGGIQIQRLNDGVCYKNPAEIDRTTSQLKQVSPPHHVHTHTSPQNQTYESNSDRGRSRRTLCRKHAQIEAMQRYGQPNGQQIIFSTSTLPRKLQKPRAPERTVSLPSESTSLPSSPSHDSKNPHNGYDNMGAKHGQEKPLNQIPDQSLKMVNTHQSQQSVHTAHVRHLSPLQNVNRRTGIPLPSRPPRTIRSHSVEGGKDIQSKRCGKHGGVRRFKVSSTLVSSLMLRLKADNIDLIKQASKNKIPSSLVDHYAQEFQKPPKDIAIALDECRSRLESGTFSQSSPESRPTADLLSPPGSEYIQDLLSSIGLSGYLPLFTERNLFRISEIRSFSDDEYRIIGVRDASHIAQIRSALESTLAARSAQSGPSWLKGHFQGHQFVDKV